MMARPPRYIEALGSNLTLSEWVQVAREDFGIVNMTMSTLKVRLHRGWDLIRSITTPLRQHNRNGGQTIIHPIVRGIYYVKNRLNSKKYIGCSTDIYYRFDCHRHQRHSNRNLKDDIEKFGISNFEFVVVEEMPGASQEELETKETVYVQLEDPRFLYNITEHPTTECLGCKMKCCPKWCGQ